jgi:WD40 repeat protein
MSPHGKPVLGASATLVLLLTAALQSPSEPFRALGEDSAGGAKDSVGDVLPPGAIARCGTTRMRLPDGVAWSMAYVSEGKVLVTGGTGVFLFDPATGAPWGPGAIKAPEGLFACSPDGKWLATHSWVGSRERGVLRLWSLAKGGRPEFDINLVCYSLVFSPDGTRLAVGSEDGGDAVVAVVDLKTRTVKTRLTDLSAGAKALAFSPDGKLLAVGGWKHLKNPEESHIRVFDLTNPIETVVARLKNHESEVWSLTFALGGKVLASSGGDKKVRLWDTAKWEELGVIDTPGIHLTASPDGKMLATCGGQDDVVRFWDPAGGKNVGELSTSGRPVYSCAFSPDGKRLATGGPSLTVRQWDTATGKEVLPLPGHYERVSAVVFSPDGKTLASHGDGRATRFWDPATGNEKRRLAVEDARDSGSSHFSLAFSPDWTKLALIGPRLPPRPGQGSTNEQKVQVRNVKDGTVLFTFNQERFCFSLAMSPDGQVVASAFRGVRLFSLRSGEELAFLGGPKPPNTTCLAFSPDGRTLAAGIESVPDGDTLQLWDWTTRKLLRTLPGHKLQVVAVSFSPGGHILATSGPGREGEGPYYPEIRLWEMASGTVIRTIRAHERRIACVALSPDGRMLASVGHDDKTVRVWDAFTGKELAKFTGHSGPVNTVAWSPDGKRLASGSSDTTILVWDTSRLKAEPPATDAKPATLARLWDGLRQRESAKAFDALWLLVGAGDKAAELFDKQLKPVLAPDAVELRKLLADLGDNDPKTRDAAGEALAKLGPLAEPALREKLKEEMLDPEARKRIDELLEKLRNREPTDDELRDGRAVLALELIGTAKARDVLRKLADGAPGSPMTRDAKATLQRLRPAYR